MKVGLLWYDNDTKRNLTEKIARAANFYRSKFGIAPDTCYVHKSCLGGNGQTAQAGHIQVLTSPLSLLHHFWIGHEDQP